MLLGSVPSTVNHPSSPRSETRGVELPTANRCDFVSRKPRPACLTGGQAVKTYFRLQMALGGKDALRDAIPSLGRFCRGFHLEDETPKTQKA